MYYNMLRYPRQITLDLFDPYTFCFSLTRWRLNKNTFNEKFLSLSFFQSGSPSYAENSPKWKRANVTFDGHCNERIRVSTLRYSETFYSPGRNTFDLIFFPSSLPSYCRCWGDELPRKRETCCVEQGHIGNAGWEYFDTSLTVKIEIKPRGIASACPRVEAGGIGWRNSTIREAGSGDHAVGN